jgi:hypothetical protein
LVLKVKCLDSNCVNFVSGLTRKDARKEQDAGLHPFAVRDQREGADSVQHGKDESGEKE